LSQNVQSFIVRSVQVEKIEYLFGAGHYNNEIICQDAI